jgi:hypothetical protein
MSGWQVGNSSVIGCFSCEEYNEMQLPDDTTVLISTCQGAFLKNLTKPNLQPGVFIIAPFKKPFKATFQDQELQWDGYDLLWKNQKLCEFCFYKGTMVLLRDCEPHRKNFDRSLQVEAAAIATEQLKAKASKK